MNGHSFNDERSSTGRARKKQLLWKHNNVQFQLTKRAKTFSDRFCQRRLTGNHSRRFRFRSVQQPLSVNPRKLTLTRSGSEGRTE